MRVMSLTLPSGSSEMPRIRFLSFAMERGGEWELEWHARVCTFKNFFFYLYILHLC